VKARAKKPGAPGTALAKRKKPAPLATAGDGALTVRVPRTAPEAAESQGEAERMLAWLAENPLVVSSSEQFATTGELMREALAKGKALHAMMRRALGPIEEAEKEIRSWFSPGAKAWAELAAALKDAMGAYQIAEAERARELEALAQKAAKAGDVKALTKALTAADGAGPAKAEGVTTRFVWKLKRVVPDLVPEDWKVPDVQRAEAHARAAGSSETIDPVPGFVFEREAVIGGRS
jgi:hypothetical protein